MKQGDLFAAPARPTSDTAAATSARAEAPLVPPPGMPATLPEVVPPAPPGVTVVKRPQWREAQARTVLTVTELTARIKDTLEPAFPRVLVRGEVSSFRGPNARGHLYFSLKDAGAAIEVRVWQSTARLLRFALKDGLSVVAEGQLNVYEPQGRYSLIVDKLEPDGVGARALALEQLKATLAAQGIIGPGRSKARLPLPALPRRVGVVTSVSGAALRDFLKVAHRRHPRLQVLVADTRVQGEGAAQEVARALRWLSATDVEAIVVTRGGGSVEDLWTFNEEPVARAIFACRVPVVSAVGHEIDVTLADLVADVRAPTPSAAAEAVTPVVADLQVALREGAQRLRRALERRLLEHSSALKAARAALVDPRRRVTQAKLSLGVLGDRLEDALRRRLKEEHQAHRQRGEQLQRLKPQAMLLARQETLGRLERRLHAAGRRVLEVAREALHRRVRGMERASVAPRLARSRDRLDSLWARVRRAVRARLAAERARVTATAGHLDALSPLRVLGRGYALVRRQSDGALVRSSADAPVGTALTLKVASGEVLGALRAEPPSG